jgi:hypothetical protein
MPWGFDDDIVIEILNAVLPEERQEVGSQHIRPNPSRPDPMQLSTSGAQFGIARLAINSAISYEVLSHTWGDDDDQQKITVRDQIQFDDDSSKRSSAYQEILGADQTFKLHSDTFADPTREECYGPTLLVSSKMTLSLRLSKFI